MNVSTVCIGEYVGLEEIADGIRNVYFGPLRLGRLSERHQRIEDEYGRLYRRHVSPMSPDCFVTYLPDRSLHSIEEINDPSLQRVLGTYDEESFFMDQLLEDF